MELTHNTQCRSPHPGLTQCCLAGIQWDSMPTNRSALFCVLLRCVSRRKRARSIFRSSVSRCVNGELGKHVKVELYVMSSGADVAASADWQRVARTTASRAPVGGLRIFDESFA